MKVALGNWPSVGMAGVRRPNRFQHSMSQTPMSQGQPKVESAPLRLAGGSQALLPAMQTVYFGKRTTLMDKYGLPDVSQVPVHSAQPVALTKAQKEKIAHLALVTYEHAQKARLMDEGWIANNPDTKHISGRNFSTTIVLENGITVTAVNSEYTRDDILCGERSAIVSAINRAYEKMDLDRLQDPEYYAKQREGLKVKQLIMSGAHRHQGSENVTDPTLDNLSSAAPCSDCQAWMATAEYFSPETEIWTLKRTDDQFDMQRQTIGEIMPLWNDQNISRTDEPLETLPVSISGSAREVIDEAETRLGIRIDEERFRDMFERAKAAYNVNPFAEVSRKNGAVAALFSPIDEIITSERFDITPRWYINPAETVLKKGFEKIAAEGHSTDPAKGALALVFAFYGDYPQPTMNDLGRLSQLERGDGADKVLVARIEKDIIQVKTLRELMREVYMSARAPREGGK